MVLSISSQIFSLVSLGLDPILLNLSEITFSLSKSFSTSFRYWSLFDDVFSSSIQPIREVNGVPIWWAVSFAMPDHNIFISAIFVLLKNRKAKKPNNAAINSRADG